MRKILCFLGFHSWVWQSKLTGVFIHCYTYESRPGPDAGPLTGLKKCEFCQTTRQELTYTRETFNNIIPGDPHFSKESLENMIINGNLNFNEKGKPIKNRPLY